MKTTTTQTTTNLMWANKLYLGANLYLALTDKAKAVLDDAIIAVSSETDEKRKYAKRCDLIDLAMFNFDDYSSAITDDLDDDEIDDIYAEIANMVAVLPEDREFVVNLETV